MLSELLEGSVVEPVIIWSISRSLKLRLSRPQEKKYPQALGSFEILIKINNADGSFVIFDGCQNKLRLYLQHSETRMFLSEDNQCCLGIQLVMVSKPVAKAF